MPSNTSAKKKQYYIMGFATHLLGDLYAHRLIVPVSTIEKNTDGQRKNQFISSDFKNYSNFKNKVKKGSIQFRDIKEYTKSDSPSLYEDNINFVSKRYKIESVSAIECFFAYYKDKIDIPLVIKPETSLKLGNYSAYIKAIS